MDDLELAKIELEQATTAQKQKNISICQTQLQQFLNNISMLGCKLNIVEIRVNGQFLKYEFQITAD